MHIYIVFIDPLLYEFVGMVHERHLGLGNEA